MEAGIAFYRVTTNSYGKDAWVCKQTIAALCDLTGKISLWCETAFHFDQGGFSKKL